MTTEEKRFYEDAWTFINMQVKAAKMMNKKFDTLQTEDIINLSAPVKKIQMYNIIKLCKIANIPTIRQDWAGNASCSTDYDEVYFIYKGIKFFGLEDKEDERQ